MEGVESAVSTVNNRRDDRRNDAAVATDAALYFTYSSLNFTVLCSSGNAVNATQYAM
jgi:hypothetical protein